MTDVRDYLRSKGITFREVRRPAGVQAMFPCPLCGSKSFSVNVDTGAFSCLSKNKCGVSGGYYNLQKVIFGDEPKKIYKENKIYGYPQHELRDPDDEIRKFFESRAINYDKAREHFKFMQLGSAIAFRYFEHGVHIATKYRGIKEKKFYNEKDCKPGLYNIDNCRNSNVLYITEGEMDCIALYDLTGLDAVSVPNGTGDTRWIEDNWPVLEGYSDIVLVFDSDKAGQEAAANVAKRLGAYRCSRVVLPCKDINECLVQKMSADKFLGDYLFKPQPFERSKVIVSSHYKEMLIARYQNPVKGVQLKSFKHFMKVLGGIRNSESTILTGQNHAGKSTLINQLVIDLIDSGEKVAIASLEMPPERYLEWLIKQTMTAEETYNEKIIEKKLDKIGEQLYCIDMKGKVNPEELLEHLRLACSRNGCTQIFVDSLMKIKLERKDFLRAQEDFIDAFIDVTHEYDIHGWLVAHPRKGAEDNDRPGKVDVAGAGHITNAPDNVITLWRPDEKTREDLRAKNGYAPASVLSVKKNREEGVVGDVFLGFVRENKKLFEHEAQPKPIGG